MESISQASQESPAANLTDLHSWLEGHAIDFQDLQEIANEFQKIRDKLSKSGDSEQVESAQWELEVFSFVLRDGKLIAHFHATDKEGNPFSFPSMGNFDDRALKYVETRQNETNNPILKARYSHVLWESPVKRQQHGRAAIEAYLETLPLLDAKDEKDPEGLFGREIVYALKAALSIAIQIRMDLNGLKSELLRILSDYPQERSSWFRVRYDLVQLILENKRLFLESEIHNLPEFCSNTAELLMPVNIHAAISMYELGDKVDKNFGSQSFDWSRKIGAAYEDLVSRRENEPMSACHFCDKALEYYRRAKDIRKVEELERKRLEFAKLITPQTISTEIDLTDHLKWCDKVANELTDKSSDEILQALISDPGLLPRYEDVQKLAEETLHNHPLLALIGEQIMDPQMNVVQNVATPEEKHHVEMIRLMSFHIWNYQIYLIEAIITAAFTKGKLSFEIIVEFLHRHSWYGQIIRPNFASDEKHDHAWLEIIKPGLNSYCKAIHARSKKSEDKDAIILALDSLTTKFEGLIRDLCQIQGTLTTYDRKDLKGNTVTYQKDVSILLREKAIEALLLPQDLLFLKYLLVEQSGLCLRHSIAHALMHFRDYEIGRAHLVIVGLLRLSKFQLK